MSNSSGINLKLILAYDGTHYLGWQKTPTGPSIEGTLQKVIEQIVQHPVHLQAASRTDAGVHAKGQTVNFYLQKENFDLSKLFIGINSLLPKDIVVLSIVQVSPHFHPTLDCVGKEYVYRLCYAPVQLPQDRLYEWHYPYPLDIEKMGIAANHLMGKHDFSAFRNTRKTDHYLDGIREIKSIDIEKFDLSKLIITVKGDHFMYKMVRNLVGTVVYVGAGKIEVEALNEILQSKDRTQAGLTAPAHGLTLQTVSYN